MDVGSNTNMQIIKEKKGSKSSYELKQKQHNNSNNYYNNKNNKKRRWKKKNKGEKEKFELDIR